MIQVQYVVVLIVRPHGRGHQLLMAKRSRGKYMGDTWQLVSGGLEANETAWQGALREMREETGLVPQAFYRLSTLTQFYRPDNDSLNTAPMFCALVADDSEVRIDTEHSAFKWVDVADAARQLMWPSDRQALEEVRSVILAGGIAKQHMQITPQGASE